MPSQYFVPVRRLAWTIRTHEGDISVPVDLYRHRCRSGHIRSWGAVDRDASVIRTFWIERSLETFYLFRHLTLTVFHGDVHSFAHGNDPAPGDHFGV